MVPQILYSIICLFCITGPVYAQAGIHDAGDKTLSYYITRSGSFATFEQALEYARLFKRGDIDMDLLIQICDHLDIKPSKLQNITIFVPHEQAFRDMPDYIRDQLFADPRKMRDVLLYHMIGGRYTSDQFDDGIKSTLFNERITIQKLENGEYMLDGHARIINSDVVATDGVIHTIDRILLP